MNPTIAKYREAIGRQRAGGFDLTMVSVADLAALLDIAEAALQAERDDECPVSIRDALARLNGDKA